MNASYSKVRQREAKRFKRLKEREAAEAAEMEKVLAEFFDKYDTDYSASLEPTEIRKLIAELELGPEPDDATLKRITMYAAGTDGKVDRADMAKLLYVYKNFTLQHEVVTKTFEAHDTDSSGFLDLKELLTLLKHLTPEVTVTESDLAFVLNKCDKDKDSKIGAGELLLVGSVWLEVQTKEKADAEAEPVDLDTFEYEAIVAFDEALERTVEEDKEAAEKDAAAATVQALYQADKAKADAPASVPPADYGSPAAKKKSSMCVLL